MRRVLVLSDGVRERELQLVGRIVVGRDPTCEVSHDHSLLSRRHAEFVADGDVIVVRDLGSRNGVFVNGARIAEYQLQSEDVVQIGPLRGRCVVVDTPPPLEPDEMERERTAVIRKAFAGAASVPVEDEDATRLVPAPRMPVIQRQAGEAEAPTRFMSPAGAAAARGAGVGTLSAEAPVAAGAAAVPSAGAGDRLRGFIFGQVTLLAGLVLAAGALPIVLRAQSTEPFSLSWVALPALAALAGAYIVGSSIAGRVADAIGESGRSRR